MATPIGFEFTRSLVEAGLYPVWTVPVTKSRCKVPAPVWAELAGRLAHESLRTVAKDYGISHETARQIAARANSPAATSATPGKSDK